MSDDNSRRTAFVAEHPRLIGALIALTAFLAQAGSAAAAANFVLGP